MKILITGASSGLGAELARQYVNPENELILLARREERLCALRSELFEKCKSVEVIVADLSDFKTLQDKIQTITTLDMLILNAGVSLESSRNREDIPTIAAFENLYRVNVLANHAILEVLLPLFKAQKSGKIVFISSLASLFSMPSSEIYSSSKRAINAYAEGIRYQYKAYGIKVLTILPGFIESEMTVDKDMKMPFIYPTQEGVAKIKNAIDKGKEYYAFPKKIYFFIKLVNLLPMRVREKILQLLS